MNDLDVLNAELDEYKRKIGELEVRVEELSDFVENASIPLHWVDGSGIITWANQAELDALGFQYEEYVGQPISNFHADAAVIDDILTRLINNETLYNYPARLKAKDDSIKHVLISSNVLWKDGKFVHTRCFTKDVTDLKKEEQRKNDFVAMVSHELRTPLTTLTSIVQILKRRSNKEQDDFTIDALTRAELQAKKMAKMLNDFLSQAKYEEGKILLHKGKFNLAELITEVAADAQFLSRDGVEFTINCEDIFVYADRDKIGQVLTNLISNAIKYSPKGGAIAIQCKRDQKKATVSVSDLGIGINPVDQQRLFERFYRVINENLPVVQGFGIGLYLVSEILRYHHSEIHVTSEEGKGSTFYFSLDIVSTS